MADYVEGKNKIRERLVGTGEPGSPVHEQKKMAIIAPMTGDLEKAIGGLRASLTRQERHQTGGLQ